MISGSHTIEKMSFDERMDTFFKAAEKLMCRRRILTVAWAVFVSVGAACSICSLVLLHYILHLHH